MANEKKLIYADDARRAILEADPKLAYCIERIKAVDAVEVVRCKDCKWYRIAPIDNVPYCCHESGYCGEHMKGLFFCACGERKDNGIRKES